MLKIAVIGATGNVGQMVLEMLLTSNPNLEIEAVASSKSEGKKLTVSERDFTIKNIDNKIFHENEICIFNTESDISEKYIPIALKSGAYVIDSSSRYRLEVPLIVPSINLHLIKKNIKFYSTSNCIVSPIATVLEPIHRLVSQIERVIVSTYQSVSGGGKKAMDYCLEETKNFTNENDIVAENSPFSRQIAFNIIPCIGTLNDNNICDEEVKISAELKKVISEKMTVMATTVRVPVIVGHSSSVSIKLSAECTLNEVLSIIKDAKGVRLLEGINYITPAEVVGERDVFVSRVRLENNKNETWIHMWLCSDNLMMGAAVDVIEVANELTKILCQN